MNYEVGVSTGGRKHPKVARKGARTPLRRRRRPLFKFAFNSCSIFNQFNANDTIIVLSTYPHCSHISPPSSQLTRFYITFNLSALLPIHFEPFPRRTPTFSHTLVQMSEQCCRSRLGGSSSPTSTLLSTFRPSLSISHHPPKSTSSPCLAIPR